MKTRPVTVDEFITVVKTINNGGFQYKEVVTDKATGEKITKDRTFRANPRMAFALQLEANLGIRMGDVLALKLTSFRENGRGGYMIDIIEQKTSKARTFDIPNSLYDAIKAYVDDNGLSRDDLFFPIKIRVLQKNLKIVTEYLGLNNVSTHSFRKFYAMRIFENNDFNYEIVRELLQHSTVAVTQKYLGVTSSQVKKAIDEHSYLVI